MTRKFWSVAIIIFLLINTALIVMMWLDRPEKQRPRPQGPVNDFLQNELQLTAKQEEQFEAERKAHFEKMEPLLRESREKRDEMFDQISSTDTSKITVLSNELVSLEAQKEVNTVYHFRRLRSLLTEEQKTKFDKIFRDLLRMMSGNRPPNGGGPPDHNGPPPRDGMPPHEPDSIQH
jgi:Spy/CpxP family protein refolding chaperone